MIVGQTLTLVTTLGTLLTGSSLTFLGPVVDPTGTTLGYMAYVPLTRSLIFVNPTEVQ